MPPSSPPSGALSPHLSRSVLLLSFATFASMSVQRLCDAMLPALSAEFMVTLPQAARVVSAFAVVYGVAQLIYGPLGDRLGKFRIVALTTMACSLGSLLAVFSPSLDLLVMARMLVALFAAALIPLSLAWIGDVVPYAQRQATLARAGLGTTLGIVGGQLIGGVLADTLGWRWAFAGSALMFGVVGALLWQEWRRQQADPALRPAPAAPGARRTGFMAQAWPILRARWTRFVLLVALVEGASSFGLLAIWASHLHRELGLSLSGAGATASLFGLGGMLYMALARWLIPRLGEHGLALTGAGLLGVSALVLALTPVWQPALPACLLGGFGFFMFHNTMQVNVTQMAPDSRGTAVSLFAAFMFLGQSLGVMLAAALAERLGSAIVIACGGALLFTAGAVFAAALRRRHAGNPEISDK